MAIAVKNYVSELLYSHDCVIIPGFGGFITNYQEATVDPAQGYIHPPSKGITFNPELQVNDGLLINHIARKEHVSYSEARDAVEEYTRECRSLLDQGEILAIPKVGKLYRDIEQKTRFIPDDTNFLLASFGLPKVQFFPVVRAETQGEKAAIIGANLEKDKVARKIKKKPNRVWIPAAASIGVIFLVGLTAWFLSSDMIGNNKPHTESASKENTGKGLASLLDSGITIEEHPLSEIEEEIPDDSEASVTDNKETETAGTTKPELNTDVKSDSGTEEAGNEMAEKDKTVNKPEEKAPAIESKPETEIPDKDKTIVEKSPTSAESKVPSSPTETLSKPAAGQKEYRIVIGCFQEMSNVDRLVKKVESNGYQAELGKQGRLNRVAIVVQCKPEDLNSVYGEIKNQFTNSAWILRR